MSLSRLVFVLLLVAGVAQLFHYLPRLPDPVASHFNGAGVPDGWSSKRSFVVIELGVLGLMAFTFLGLTWFLDRMPTSLINMPHRDYWLAPERRAETVAVLADQLLWFGVVTLLLLLGVMQMVIDANLSTEPRLGNTTLGWIVAYLGFTVIWLVAFVRRFQKVP